VIKGKRLYNQFDYLKKLLFYVIFIITDLSLFSFHFLPFRISKKKRCQISNITTSQGDDTARNALFNSDHLLGIKSLIGRTLLSTKEFLNNQIDREGKSS